MSAPHGYNYIPLDQKKSNKVYINPNYSKNAIDNRNYFNNMYMNRNFSCAVPNLNHVQYQNQVDQTRPKIYVNPNFITPPTIYTSQVSNKCHDRVNPLAQSKPVDAVSVSRYSLVRRHKENQTLNTVANPTKLVTNTVKINKYKSVSLNSVKSKLTVQQKPEITQKSTSEMLLNHKTKKYKLNSSIRSRYKLVKGNTSKTEKNISKYQLTKTINKNTTISNTPTQSTMKQLSRLVLKKNNIPCPLFKKYGTCLRQARGTCEYLHDKKHVSICRKFLKGICHDINCLLSHDLTDKKMPTCYFYLQGTCTHENCPYLHVKLNEKAKVCKEFLKGYCEKGDQCLHRHIYVCPKQQVGIKSHLVSEKVKKRQSLKVKLKRKASVQNEINIKENNSEEALVREQRYFKESVVNTTEHCNLKPSRCKLGTLPSFIHL